MQLSPAHPASLDSAEWLLLLECASPVPHAGELAAQLRNVNWPELLRIAEEHGVLGHVAARLHERGEDSVPREVLDVLRERHRAQLFLSLKMSAELFRLMDRFTAVGIATIAIKGPVLAAQAYANSGVRSYGDLDLLVRQRDIRRATEAMIAEGYQPRIPVTALPSEKIPGQYFFHHPDSQLIVELHNENTLRYFPRRLPLEKVFERKISVLIHGREVPALSVEDCLILICIHGAKHFWERLMWIADVAGLVSRQQAMDWEQVSAAAHEVGAGHMVHAGLQLAAKLLKTPLPPSIAARVQRDTAAAHIAGQVVRWLPVAGTGEPTLLQRALFRMRMRGGIFSASGYLLRLSLSPTEEDWGDTNQGSRHWLWDAVRRPFRLVRKHRRGR